MRISVLAAAGLTLAAFTQYACAGNAVRGQQLYSAHCAVCHGMGGEGIMPDAPKFRMGDRLEQPDVMLMQSVRGGKGKMPPFFGVLKDNDILDILSYVRTLR